jgi:hypothetical protein
LNEERDGREAKEMEGGGMGVRLLKVEVVFLLYFK